MKSPGTFLTSYTSQACEPPSSDSRDFRCPAGHHKRLIMGAKGQQEAKRTKPAPPLPPPFAVISRTVAVNLHMSIVYWFNEYILYHIGHFGHTSLCRWPDCWQWGWLWSCEADQWAFPYFKCSTRNVGGLWSVCQQCFLCWQPLLWPQCMSNL